MKTRMLSSILVLATIFAHGLVFSAPPAYPLKISADARYFVDQNDVPFFINGDTPWSLIGQVSREDAEFYLQDCAARDINSLIVTLVEGYYADNAPANYYGVQPFTTPNDFTTPNEPYFTHADWVINKAAEYGIQIILAPYYLGCCGDGWYYELRNYNSEADARWFGEWVGNRYRDFPNLMYVWGNDLSPGDVRSKIRAMAEGAKSTDANHLQTYHGHYEESALDLWSVSESWLDLNVTYTYQAVQLKSLQDYNRSPFLPFFLFESQYENDWMSASAQQTRKQAYNAVLSGAAGHHYGNNPIWHMNGKPGDNSKPWRQALDDEGRADLPHVAALFESRQWYGLVPDQQHIVITAGYGSGQNYVAAARTSDGATVMAYLPDRRQVTVNMEQVTGDQATSWWFNPRDGSAQLIGSFATSGTMNFTPPSDSDWVLVLDDSARNFPAPGESHSQQAPSAPNNFRVVPDARVLSPSQRGNDGSRPR